MKLVKGYRNIKGGFSPPVHGLGRYGATPPAKMQDVPPEYAGNPVFLSASAYVEPKGTAAPNNEALRNPYDHPIEIFEVRFTAWGIQNKTASGYGSPGPQLSVSLALDKAGEHGAVTKDFVPIYCICPGAQLNNESTAFVMSEQAPAYFGCNYRMALKTPLVLQPRECLTARFQNNGYVSNGGVAPINNETPGSVTMHIAYLGRTRPDLAGRSIGSRTVPYFAAWVPSALSQPASGVAPNEAVSAETDLENQSAQPVRLCRLIGRLASQATAITYQTGTTILTELTDSNLSYQPQAFPAQEAIQVKMTRSNGTPVIAPGTPFRLAFDSLDRSWDIDDANLILEPKDYLRAAIQIVAPDSDITASTSQVFAAIGLTGYREVEVAS